ncbi:MAG: very short patch repair endonuclease [Planctomycetales bacterium]
MTDTFSAAKRSQIMSRVRSKDTTPELIVRKLCFSLGYRSRLHAQNLPGKPDLVFPGRSKVIFVHGCFWHLHTCKRGRNVPASRVEYWENKLNRNKPRDQSTRRRLRYRGWKVLTVWECQTRVKKRDWLADRIVGFLEEDG